MAELRIPIIVENKGKKAFAETNKATATLEKGVKRLGGALAATFGAQQLLKFAKNAAKAFIEDEKAATRLAQSVKNLGLAFETPRIEKFISELSAASGVTDDQLRPAMQRLLQTTGSVAKAQELLTQALDISAGSGVEYETVVNDLALAYTGQTRGLRKYSLGLSQAELKTMSFADVQEKLTKQFSGANAAYLETYAGKMQLLSTAAGEAQETIGKGLVDALSLLAGEGNTVQPLADSMAEFSLYTSDAIVGIALLIDKIKKIPGVGNQNVISQRSFAMFPTLASLGILKKGLDYVSKTGAEYRALTTPITQGYLGSMPVGIYPSAAELATQRQLEAQRLKLERERAALAKKANIEARKKAALDKASKTLDIERINLTAALKGKISESDRISLQLQLALLDKNEAQATKLSAELDAAVKRNNELAAALLATPKAPNPYADWKVPTLDFGGNLLGSPVPNFVPPAWSMPEMYGQQGGLGAGVVAGVNPQVNVTVQLDSQVVGDAVRDVQVNESLSGSFSQVNRRGRFADQIL